MNRKRIWLGVGAFVLAAIVVALPSHRSGARRFATSPS